MHFCLINYAVSRVVRATLAGRRFERERERRKKHEKRNPFGENKVAGQFRWVFVRVPQSTSDILSVRIHQIQYRGRNVAVWIFHQPIGFTIYLMVRMLGERKRIVKLCYFVVGGGGDRLTASVCASTALTAGNSIRIETNGSQPFTICCRKIRIETN